MEKVKWGVLGTAGILSCTGVGMQKAEHCITYAIAGRDAAKTKEYAEKYGFEKTYSSYDELLLDDDIEAVYIPLPNNLHYEWTIAALKRGKHVLCEKPLAESYERAKEMYNTAKENGVYLMEAFAYQHSSYIEALANEIKNGSIGDVTFIDTEFTTTFYDKSNIRMRKDMLGGSAYDLGVYGSSFILRFIDDKIKDIKAVASFNDDGVDLYTHALIEFDGGKTAAFTCGMIYEPESGSRFDSFEIRGTKGFIRPGIYQYNLSGEMSYEVVTAEGVRVEKMTVEDNYGLEVEQLSRCVRGEAVPYVTEEFSLRNAKVIDGVLEAIGY